MVSEMMRPLCHGFSYFRLQKDLNELENSLFVLFTQIQLLTSKDMAHDAAAAAAASSSSSATFSPKKFDAFISFRGEDTRNNFTSHLYDAFCRKQIHTYIDYRLHKGEEISSALMQAIEDSYVSVVVFSENYASSRWCLDELSKILECKRDQGQVVIPVLYKVEPSHVRHQTGSYKQAMEKHERDLIHNQQKVCKWRSALIEAASFAGWDSHVFRDESELIQKIVKDVLQKLDHKYLPTELRGLVGIDENFSQIELLLKSVQTVGIWGMGGIGKTTIAKSIFIKYSSQYEGCCFLANVRENSGKHENGLYDLRYKLVSKLLEEENLYIGTSAVESGFVECRLKRKRVFIVLDDVSTLKQVEYLIGELHCFGPGSKIIITTRDKHVLSKGVDVIYCVKELEFQESLKLFSLNAFNGSLPIMGYEELSKRVVAYAKGVPLALKVLGSFLYDKSDAEWDSALRKLEKIPNEEIQNVLRLSYDGLSHEEREIFLDIACFLKGKKKEHVISLLDSYGFYADIGIRSLQDKALVVVNFRGVWMHDLIQEMGWEIVREESIKEPGERSRLWDSKEVYDVLTNNKGTEKIEGIIANVSQIKKVQLSVDTFKKMSNFRFLKFHSTDYQSSSNVHIPKGLESFPKKIRYLEWYKYPLKSLPSTFQPEMLIELRMIRSRVKKLWDGVQDLSNLKVIDLSYSKKLIELPDFSKASNLASVNLSYCVNLQTIHPSFLSLQSLNTLLLSSCNKLESLKSEIHLRSLSCLDVTFCSNLKEFSVLSEKLGYLDLRSTKEIENVHISIGHSSQLRVLSLNGSRLQKLPELSCLRSLVSLDLWNCELINNSKLCHLFNGLKSLEKLYLDFCYNITELPSNIKHLSRLQVLSLRNCKRLCYIPKLPPSIVELDARNCTSLETVFMLVTHRRVTEVRKDVSFQNCVKLDRQSRQSITEDAHSSMVQVAYGIELKRRAPSPNVDLWRKNSCKVCVPGSKVPEWFSFWTRDTFISIELPPCSHLLGFIFCAVIDHPTSKKAYMCIDTIFYTCSSGDYSDGGCSILGYDGFSNLAYDYDFRASSDYVLLWYEPVGCNYTSEKIKETMGNDKFDTNVQVSFDFFFQRILLKSSGSREYRIGIKECGVHPLYVSGYQDFIQRMEYNSKLECGSKRPRDVDLLELQQQLLSEQFKKLKVDLATQTNTCVDVDELEALLMRMKIT